MVLLSKLEIYLYQVFIRWEMKNVSDYRKVGLYSPIYMKLCYLEYKIGSSVLPEVKIALGHRSIVQSS